MYTKLLIVLGLCIGPAGSLLAKNKAESASIIMPDSTTIDSMSSVTLKPLTLKEALRLAREADLLYKRETALAKSYQDRSIAVRKYPDPRIKMSAMNFPTDSYARDQEPMTQLKVGIQQKLPRGKTLRYKSEKATLMSARHKYLAQDRALRTIRGTRKAWLELWYWNRAEKIVTYNKVLFVRGLRTTRDQYRTGRRRQEDIVRAQLEIDLLDDKLVQIRTRQQQSRAVLASWIGESAAQRPLTKKIPQFNWMPMASKIKDHLRHHPLFLASIKGVEARRRDVDIAKQAYKTGFAFEVSYAQRENRADFVSAGIAMRIPLFKGKKLDRQTQAARRRVEAETHRKDDVFVMMLRQYNDRLALWNRLKQRYRSFKFILIPRARSNSRLTTSTYRNGRTDFANMIRAQVTALNIQLKAIRIRIDLSKAHADMSYLAGEHL